jgi:hypothetical protein
LGRRRIGRGRAESWFETGLLHADDWVAGWIGRDPTTFAEVDPPQDDDRRTTTAANGRTACCPARICAGTSSSWRLSVAPGRYELV